MTAFKNAARLAVAALIALSAAACDNSDPPPLFDTSGTGTVEGLVFRDVDANGKFDPSAGDTALSNITVRLRERGTTSNIANAQGTTNAGGRFSLANVPIGSHDLAIDTTGTGTRSLAFCVNPIPVSVFRTELQFIAIDARGGCIISIAEARKKPVGTPVTIRGTVTVATGMTNSNTAFVEDASGGIALFSIVGGTPFQIGDIIELSGNLTTFNATELEITPVRVAKVTPGTPLTPKILTTAQVAAGGPAASADQGRLVRILKAKMTVAFAAGGGRNATFNDGSGNVLVRVESGVVPTVADINPKFTLNNCYNITGVIRSFNGDAQLTPRTLADIQEVPCTP
jgi:hypothetical protein